MICVCLHVTRGRLKSSASSAPSLGRSAMQWPNLMHNILSPIYTSHNSTDRKTKSFYPTECKWNENTQRQPWGAFHVRFQISLFTQRRKKRADWGDIKINLILPLSLFLFKFLYQSHCLKKLWLCGRATIDPFLGSSCASNVVLSICGITSSSFMPDYILKEVFTISRKSINYSIR